MEAVQERSGAQEVQDSPIQEENQGYGEHLSENNDENEEMDVKPNFEEQEQKPSVLENATDEISEKGESKDVQEDVENGTNSNSNEETLVDRISDEDKTQEFRRESTNIMPSNGKTSKRKKEDEESPIKKLRSEVQQSFQVRNKIFNELMESSVCKTVDQIQARIERIILEIRTLNEVALEKEREWNSIIHLRKLKEELLLRMQRKKQVLLYNSRELIENEKLENGLDTSANNNSQQTGVRTPNSIYQDKSESDKQQYNKQTTMGMLNNYVEMNGHSSESKTLKQRPVIDVQSIIADYRQRHPETVPRRGRRIRSSLNTHGDVNSRMNQSGTMNFSSVALGSGSQVKHNISNNKLDMNSELGMFFTAMENSRQNGSKMNNSEIQGNSEEPSFKDVLMQFAKLSQNERCELIQNALKPPPPYPEVTVHPVPVTTQQKNSLLHGILTQAQPKSESKTTFSPTLARLLTAPERSVASSLGNISTTNSNLLTNSPNVSISDILSNNKARHEITITPVGAQYEMNNKSKTSGQIDEDEAEDSADRLVIDESESDRNRADNSSDAGDEVPQCQGCNQQPAQFVCAGCGNQWYCSRDCQVSAWDEHSEVCSG